MRNRGLVAAAIAGGIWAGVVCPSAGAQEQVATTGKGMAAPTFTDRIRRDAHGGAFGR